MPGPIRISGTTRPTTMSFKWSTPTPPTDDPIRWRQQGAKLYATGDLVGAAAAYERYLAEPVRDLRLLAIVQALESGDLNAADARVRTFLTGQPGDLVAYRLYGQIALRRGDHEGAETIFRRTLDLVPNFFPLRHDLAAALSSQDRSAEALAVLEPVLASDLTAPAPVDLHARILKQLGRFEEAADVYAEGLEEQPNDVALLIAYGQVLRTLRRSDEAVAAFRRAVAISPAAGEAWWNLANLKTGTFTASDIRAIREAIAGATASPHDLFHLRFALARALEDAGSFEESFDEYRAANAARRALLSPAEVDIGHYVGRLTSTLTPHLVSAGRTGGHPSTAPIFILGMPRSGSTLLEQILSQHPAIEGLQELPDLTLIARALDRSEGTNGAYPEILTTLSADRLHKLGEDYLTRVQAKRRTERPFSIDKQPANWRHVALIRLILPNARIIDMRRGALACCLSMFRQHFAQGAAFSYSLPDVAAEYRAYHTLMEHVTGIWPDAIRRVRLEELVASFEPTVRSLLSWLDLPFDEACLRFDQSTRAVFTPSSEQVRRPINNESTALVSNFAPHIGELTSLLGKLA